MKLRSLIEFENQLTWQYRSQHYSGDWCSYVLVSCQVQEQLYNSRLLLLHFKCFLNPLNMAMPLGMYRIFSFRSKHWWSMSLLDITTMWIRAVGCCCYCSALDEETVWETVLCIKIDVSLVDCECRQQTGLRSCYCYKVVPKEDSIVQSLFMHDRFLQDSDEAPLVVATQNNVSSFNMGLNWCLFTTSFLDRAHILLSSNSALKFRILASCSSARTLS